MESPRRERWGIGMRQSRVRISRSALTAFAAFLLTLVLSGGPANTVLAADQSDASASGAVMAGGAGQSPAKLTYLSRDTASINDFLRLFYLPRDVIPAFLGGPNAIRVFATASVFFKPPMPLAETTSYPGLVDSTSLSLIALRCRPSDPSHVSPILATWPQVFTAITDDFGSSGFVCPTPPSPSPENELYCMVKDFVDTAQPAASTSLEHALSLGASLFDPGSPELAQALKKYYGIYPAFSGLGFSVKGSGDGHALSAQDALRNSVIPEYLLENVTLGVAGCSCVVVDSYTGGALIRSTRTGSGIAVAAAVAPASGPLACIAPVLEA